MRAHTCTRRTRSTPHGLKYRAQISKTRTHVRKMSVCVDAPTSQKCLRRKDWRARAFATCWPRVAFFGTHDDARTVLCSRTYATHTNTRTHQRHIHHPNKMLARACRESTDVRCGGGVVRSGLCICGGVCCCCCCEPKRDERAAAAARTCVVIRVTKDTGGV